MVAKVPAVGRSKTRLQPVLGEKTASFAEALLIDSVREFSNTLPDFTRRTIAYAPPTDESALRLHELLLASLPESQVALWQLSPIRTAYRSNAEIIAMVGNPPDHSYIGGPRLAELRGLTDSKPPEEAVSPPSAATDSNLSPILQNLYEDAVLTGATSVTFLGMDTPQLDRPLVCRAMGRAAARGHSTMAPAMPMRLTLPRDIDEPEDLLRLKSELDAGKWPHLLAVRTALSRLIPEK